MHKLFCSHGRQKVSDFPASAWSGFSAELIMGNYNQHFFIGTVAPFSDFLGSESHEFHLYKPYRKYHQTLLGWELMLFFWLPISLSWRTWVWSQGVGVQFSNVPAGRRASLSPWPSYMTLGCSQREGSVNPF